MKRGKASEKAVMWPIVFRFLAEPLVFRFTLGFLPHPSGFPPAPGSRCRGNAGMTEGGYSMLKAAWILMLISDCPLLI